MSHIGGVSPNRRKFRHAKSEPAVDTRKISLFWSRSALGRFAALQVSRQYDSRVPTRDARYFQASGGNTARAASRCNMTSGSTRPGADYRCYVSKKQTAKSDKPAEAGLCQCCGDYAFLRLLNPSPKRPRLSNARDAGSGTAATSAILKFAAQI